MNDNDSLNNAYYVGVRDGQEMERKLNRDYYAGMTEGRIQERERIVALLKTIRVDDDWIGLDYVIALIQGEEE